MLTLARGASQVIDKPLYQEDGSTLIPLASISAAKVELIQSGTIVQTWVHGTDDELRDSPTAGHLRLELTEEFTATLSRGPLSIRWHITLVDDTFTVGEGDGTHTDVFTDTLIRIA